MSQPSPRTAGISTTAGTCGQGRHSSTTRTCTRPSTRFSGETFPPERRGPSSVDPVDPSPHGPHRTGHSSPSFGVFETTRCSSCTISPPERTGRSSMDWTATCKKPGPSTVSTRSTTGHPTAAAASFGAKARAGSGTSPQLRPKSSPSSRRWIRRSTRRCASSSRWDRRVST